MKIAVVGCLHGKLDVVYELVRDCEMRMGFLIDLVVICGDLQAARSENDVKCMAAPDKYKQLGDFRKYYLGKKQATHLTLVVGGDCEAWNFYQTLPYGGWIAENIYYMGYANVVKVNGVRIAGISGIFNRADVDKGHYEIMPYRSPMLESMCHTRWVDTFRLLQLREPLDVMLSHDWPSYLCERPAAKASLLERNPELKDAIDKNELGSPMHDLLLEKLKPGYWFCSHLHTRHEERYEHPVSKKQSTRTVKKKPELTRRTDFIAMDAAERRPTDEQEPIFFEVINLKSDFLNVDGLEYDLEWLAVLRATDKFVSTQKYPELKPPNPRAHTCYHLEKEKVLLRQEFNDNFKIPKNFKICRPLDLNGKDEDPNRIYNYTNDQTSIFCNRVGIADSIQMVVGVREGRVQNPDAIEIDLVSDTELEENEVLEVDDSTVDDRAPEVAFWSAVRPGSVAKAKQELFVPFKVPKVLRYFKVLKETETISKATRSKAPVKYAPTTVRASGSQRMKVRLEKEVPNMRVMLEKKIPEITLESDSEEPETVKAFEELRTTPVKSTLDTAVLKLPCPIRESGGEENLKGVTIVKLEREDPKDLRIVKAEREDLERIVVESSDDGQPTTAVKATDSDVLEETAVLQETTVLETISEELVAATIETFGGEEPRTTTTKAADSEGPKTTEVESSEFSGATTVHESLRANPKATTMEASVSEEASVIEEASGSVEDLELVIIQEFLSEVLTAITMDTPRSENDSKTYEVKSPSPKRFKKEHFTFDTSDI